MANGFTQWLNLTKPEVGADSDSWGGHTNQNWDDVDGIFTSTGRIVAMRVSEDTRFVGTTTTKTIKLDLSNVSTTVERTLSVSDASGTIALQSNVDQAVPAGVVFPWAGITTTAPTGWLMCDGTTTISRTLFSVLFAAVNTTYGAGDGSTTFAVPDLRGRVIAGRDNMGGTAASRLTNTTMTPNGTTMGATGGAQTETASVSAGGTANTGGPDNTTSAAAGGDFQAANASHTHSVSVTVTGNTAAANNVQPTLILNYIIKAF